MSFEQAPLISTYPFIRKFVLAILRDIKTRNIVREEKYVVHADLVPKFSERVMRASMEMPRVLRRNPIVMPPRAPVRKVVPQAIVPPRPQIVPSMISGNVGLSQEYGRITPLLDDDSISTIECQGAEKSVMIIRGGRRQPTRIVLSADEIKEILEKVSDAVHIPILEGVFRAAIDNFSINAIVSDIIGSRFVIKKQNAYFLLNG